MRVLVTGGAGYIGSHTAKVLAESGHEPIALDNLSDGHRWAVRWGPLVEADLMDVERVRAALVEYRIDSVIHFAADAYVGESIADPRQYYRNNVAASLDLLDAMIDAGVHHVVFSSSCSVYSPSSARPLTESDPVDPASAYGDTKLAVERALRWYGGAYDISWTALRYFNAAGADPEGIIGEDHDPEMRIIPVAIEAALNRREHVLVNGTDYPTPDGTAIRDYTHVMDLAWAHVLALEYLTGGGESGILNLGTGRGSSVRDVIRTVEQIVGSPVPVAVGPRRPGDPSALVADASRAAEVLGWKPTFVDLREIVETAWRWHVAHWGRSVRPRAWVTEKPSVPQR